MRWALLILLCLFAATPASARDGDAVVANLSCSAFHRNGNGTWSPNRRLTMDLPDGALSVGPHQAFVPGQRFHTVLVADALDAACGW